MYCIDGKSCCVSPASEPKLADIIQKVFTQQETWVWQLHTVTHITAYMAHSLLSKAHCHLFTSLLTCVTVFTCHAGPGVAEPLRGLPAC